MRKRAKVKPGHRRGPMTGADVDSDAQHGVCVQHEDTTAETDCQVLLLAYRIPSPNRSAEEAAKYRHRDLPGMDDRQLWRESERVRTMLAWLDNPHPWLEARYSAVEAERTTRKRKQAVLRVKGPGGVLT
jgi:hypothetical protein